MTTKPAANGRTDPEPPVRLLRYQRALVESPARFCWANWSRQVGKSFAFSLRRMLRGLRRGRSQLLLSASERQSQELMEKVRRHAEALRLATGWSSGYWRDTHVRRLEVILPGGVRVIGLPANARTVRGFSGDVFLDEFAMHRDDRAIWAAIFPTILRGDDELFRQEFGCAFLDEATAFLTYEQIARCEDGSLAKDVDLASLERKGGTLAVGVDVGRKRDLTVIWLVRREGPALITAGVIELAGAAFRRQEDVLRQVLSVRSVSRCCIDATGLGMQLAEVTVERFGRSRVEPVTFTASSKQAMAGRLRVLAESGEIRIPVDADIRNDWHAIRRVIGAGGQVRFEADRTATGHADRFWAAALAIRAADGLAGPVQYHTEGRLTYARKGIW